ncbi:hypothetical protein [Streptomyces scopuliridis]|uniref:hypothetical protein n=1 Tax=Streptomyces scopuliridis TaxID=452529 RepID=UPI00343AC369
MSTVTAACVTPRRRLGAAEATVIVVIIIMAAFLSLLDPARPVSGLPGLAGVLGGAGAIGALIVRLAAGEPLAHLLLLRPPAGALPSPVRG